GFAARAEVRLGERMARPPAHAAGVKLPRIARRSGGICRLRGNRAIPAPARTPGGRCVPASFSAKSPMGSTLGAKLHAGFRSLIETARPPRSPSARSHPPHDRGDGAPGPCVNRTRQPGAGLLHYF
ncbi:MAG: hypothetical protein ACREDU_06595, partial [Methylocella sp.]